MLTLIALNDESFKIFVLLPKKNRLAFIGGDSKWKWRTRNANQILMNTPFIANNAQPNLIGVAHSSGAIVPAGEVGVQPIDIDGKRDIVNFDDFLGYFFESYDAFSKFLILSHIVTLDEPESSTKKSPQRKSTRTGRVTKTPTPTKKAPPAATNRKRAALPKPGGPAKKAGKALAQVTQQVNAEK